MTLSRLPFFSGFVFPGLGRISVDEINDLVEIIDRASLSFLQTSKKPTVVHDGFAES